jgi:hypothetical protein
MNKQAIITMLALCFFAAATVPAVAQPYTVCWTGAVDGDWDKRGNWNNCSGGEAPRAPTSVDTAIIKADAGISCQVDTPTERGVGTLIVEDSENIRLLIGGGDYGNVRLTVFDHMEVQGTIRIYQTATLALAGTTMSTIDGGTVVFYYDVPTGGSCETDPHGTLQIHDNLTIEGDDGQILGRKCSGPGAPTRGIIASDLGKRLTVRKASGGADFTIHGYLDIQALMTNESALVGTDASADVMLLSTHDKDGDDGRWFCYNGKLHVNPITVTGDNMWDMTLGASGAELHFEQGCVCTCLEGDFDIRGGTVYLKDDVCTTGYARLRSVSASTPKIVVYANVDGSLAGVCAGCGS